MAVNEFFEVSGEVSVHQDGLITQFLRMCFRQHQRLINHEATSFAFVASLLLTLVVGLLQRFGFLSGAALLIPALMVALWSIGLIFFSWRYQE